MDTAGKWIVRDRIGSPGLQPQNRKTEILNRAWGCTPAIPALKAAFTVILTLVLQCQFALRDSKLVMVGSATQRLNEEGGSPRGGPGRCVGEPWRVCG